MVVLDTSVVSYMFNGDSRGDYYRGRLRGERGVISFQTLEELRFGVLNGRWGERRKDDLERYLEQFEIIWPNPELVDLSASLRNERERIGKPLARADAWIAATALMLDCPLASHDRDFNDIPELDLISGPAA